MPKIKNIQREIASRNEITELIMPTIIKTIEKDYNRLGDKLDIDDKIDIYEENINLITATKITITTDSFEQEKPVVTEKGIFIGFNDKPKTLTLFSVFFIVANDIDFLNYVFHQQTFELVDNKLIDISDNDLLFD